MILVGPLFASRCELEMRFRLGGCWHGCRSQGLSQGLSMRLEWFVSDLVVLSSSKEASWWTVWYLPHWKWLQNFAYVSELKCTTIKQTLMEDGQNCYTQYILLVFKFLQLSRASRAASNRSIFLGSLIFLSIKDLSSIWQLWLRRPRLRSPDKTQFTASNRCKWPKNVRTDAKKTGMYFDVSWYLHALIGLSSLLDDL